MLVYDILLSCLGQVKIRDALLKACASGTDLGQNISTGVFT